MSNLNNLITEIRNNKNPVDKFSYENAKKKFHLP